jgi:acetyl-CoA C-acetyltransferase
MADRVVIASAVRTAGGSFGGSLKNHSAPDLGGAVIKEAVLRAGIDPNNVDQVIMGNGWQAGVGPNPARVATIRAGLSESCPAFTVNIRCGSGMRSIELGALAIRAGESDIVVAGGMESSSNVPYLLTEARWGLRMGDKKVRDSLHQDGFYCPLADMFMGDTAGILVEKYNITREEQDSYSYSSHKKAIAAIDNGAFSKEILAIDIVDKKKQIKFDTDEIPRREIETDKLARLPSVFKMNDSITAGNSCALCDAGSAVVLMSESHANDLKIKPLAVIRSYSFVALSPREMGLGPVPAIREALKKAKMNLKDIDIIEINEAFAAQIIACHRELNFDESILNVNGGAIALGHPVGATGAKILTTLLYAMENRNLSVGLASLCIGGGQGVAMIVERV